jgi:hypothetical protein
MSWTIQIEFDPHKHTGVLADNIGVIMENGDMMDIPLLAHPATIDVEVPSSISFGTLFRETHDNWNNSVDKTIEIRNNGKKKATFNLLYDIALPFTVNPSIITLGPRKSVDAKGGPMDVATIKVKVIPSQQGAFEYPVKINVSEGEKINV